jgi:hypothetical protein
VAVGAVAAGQWLGRTSGSTRAERRRPLPGDELVDHPVLVTNHAVTIPAPPERVWPWLVQMGWHRGGWYTARWVDRLLFPANRPSATELVATCSAPWPSATSSPTARPAPPGSWSPTSARPGGTRLLLRVRGRRQVLASEAGWEARVLM